MIVFNRNIFFSDEPKLNTDIKNGSLETIFVSEKPLGGELDVLTLETEWIPMSGQQGRYRSSTPFRNEGTFSWALEIKDILTLFWHSNTREIFYLKESGYTPERLRFWVLHTFLPLVLELEQTYSILHVGSVEVYGKPILFSAFSFGGKSTLTDYFLKQGHPLLSDDSLGIQRREDGYYAIPSYPFHRPYRQLETLGYFIENFEAKPKPLHAIFSLEKRDADADIKITEISGIEKFKALHYSSFVNFDFMKKKRFDFFMEMAKYIPAYKIEIPWDTQRLPEVYSAIITHITATKAHHIAPRG